MIAHVHYAGIRHLIRPCGQLIAAQLTTAHYKTDIFGQITACIQARAVYSLAGIDLAEIVFAPWAFDKKWISIDIAFSRPTTLNIGIHDQCWRIPTVIYLEPFISPDYTIHNYECCTLITIYATIIPSNCVVSKQDIAIAPDNITRKIRPS